MSYLIIYGQEIEYGSFLYFKFMSKDKMIKKSYALQEVMNNKQEVIRIEKSSGKKSIFNYDNQSWIEIKNMENSFETGSINEYKFYVDNKNVMSLYDVRKGLKEGKQVSRINRTTHIYSFYDIYNKVWIESLTSILAPKRI